MGTSNTTVEKKSKEQFIKDRFEIDNALNNFCIKYADVIMGFSVRHNSVMHPSVIEKCGKGLSVFSIESSISLELLDKFYK